MRRRGNFWVRRLVRFTTFWPVRLRPLGPSVFDLSARPSHDLSARPSHQRSLVSPHMKLLASGCNFVCLDFRITLIIVLNYPTEAQTRDKKYSISLARSKYICYRKRNLGVVNNSEEMYAIPSLLRKCVK